MFIQVCKIEILFSNELDSGDLESGTPVGPFGDVNLPVMGFDDLPSNETRRYTESIASVMKRGACSPPVMKQNTQ